jgi:methionyl-tRNA formyltransferase
MSIPANSQKNFASVNNIVLIGGGDLMAKSAQIFHNLNFNVSLITAPRHSSESLVLTDETLAKIAKKLHIKHTVIDNINALSKEQLAALIPNKSMAICFGPAWIFTTQVINAFEYGMFNINAIPIPHYLGGAHYTWQLLNKNNAGGCFFQQITTVVDQGDIYSEHKFLISENATTPHDYFVENVQQGCIFIKKLAQMFLQGNDFHPYAYGQINNQRLYFPRLRTDKQGFINWQWDAEAIVSFCQAFDKPYIGAASFIANQLIRIRKMKLTTITDHKGELIPAMHPFCAGLIIRKLQNSTQTRLLVAAINGFIEVEEVYDEQGNNISDKLKEGMRLHTPQSTIDAAMAYQVTLDGHGFKD